MTAPEDKLPLVKDYMKNYPKSSKRTIIRIFEVTQHVIARWERAGELRFLPPRVNNGFNFR